MTKKKKPPTACVYRQLVRHEAILSSSAVGKLELTKMDLGIFEFVGLFRFRSGLKVMYHYTYYYDY